MALRASEMGLTSTEFWALTYADYVWMWGGYERKAERYHYTPAREIMSVSIRPHLKKGTNSRGGKMWPLSIDFKKPGKTPEELKAIFDWLKSDNGWNNKHKLN
jgi:hypothetical protein